MKKLASIAAVVVFFSGFGLTSLAAKSAQNIQTNIKNDCKRVKGRLIAYQKKKYCLVNRKLKCRIIKRKVKTVYGKPACIMQKILYQAVPGIEGRDLGSGG